MTDQERQQLNKRRTQRRRQRSIQMWCQRILAAAVLVALIALIPVAVSLHKRSTEKQAAEQAQAEAEAALQAAEEQRQAQEAEQQFQELLDSAAQAAAGYDYDAALQILKSSGSDSPEVQERIAEYETAKAELVPVDPSQVTHIFYHSLIVDPDLCFSDTSSLVAGFKQWMTTVDEFNAITQQMYDNGYVLVSLYDLVDQTVDEDGTVHFTPATIYLPPDKKAFVLSVDDLSYYHSYDNHGIASKIVLDADGKPTCEYIQPDGTVVTGAYDVVPLMDAFLEEHPDGAYHGARGTIALTGYDGILGYRTDIAYKTRENLDIDQGVWLDAHPDFDWDAECAEAKKVADAIKADGWTFASHTWGHLHIADVSLERLKTDTEKWQNYVAPLVGGSDIIVFAHGQDMTAWNEDYLGNEKYEYLTQQGFHFFCNVDSNKYTLNIHDTYVRQGRRNLDGYRIWNDVNGSSDRLGDLFDPATVLDPKRTDMPAL